MKTDFAFSFREINPRSHDVPWSERFWIYLFSKETQNPFSDSFGFKNPILDFLKERTLRLLQLRTEGQQYKQNT